MEKLSMIIAMLTISATVFGGAMWVFEKYSEPTFVDGEYYTNAWMDESEEQITLHVEFIPDGRGKGTLAVVEAVERLRDKARINPELRSKPVVVIAEVRQQTKLTPIAVVMLSKPYVNLDNVPLEQLITRIMRNTTITFNGTCINVTNTSSGEQTCLPVNQLKPDASLDKIAATTLAVLYVDPEGIYTSR